MEGSWAKVLSGSMKVNIALPNPMYQPKASKILYVVNLVCLMHDKMIKAITSLLISSLKVVSGNKYLQFRWPEGIKNALEISLILQKYFWNSNKYPCLFLLAQALLMED